MKGFDINLAYILGMIAAGTYVSVYFWFQWQDVILGVMFLFGFVSWRDPFILPWFLYPLEVIVKGFAIVFFLIIVLVAENIDKTLEDMKGDSKE
jgi:hypothetical protein